MPTCYEAALDSDTWDEGHHVNTYLHGRDLLHPVNLANMCCKCRVRHDSSIAGVYGCEQLKRLVEEPL